MVTERIQRITAANHALLSFLPIWEEHRHKPDIADFAFGNPQEMVVEGFASAITSSTTPRSKNHYAYKFSEVESQRTVANHLLEWRGQTFDPEDIAMTPGAFGAIAIALGALVDVGDEVVYFDPPWFFYRSMILASGAIPINVPVRSDDYDLDLERLAQAITEKTRLLIVNTPHNPTGRIYPPSTLEGLADLLTDASERFGKPIYLLSDEPYSKLVFSDAKFSSPAEYYPHTLISYSYGKILLTPGQRVGWLAWTPKHAGPGGAAFRHLHGPDRRRLVVPQRSHAVLTGRIGQALHRSRASWSESVTSLSPSSNTPATSSSRRKEPSISGSVLPTRMTGLSWRGSPSAESWSCRGPHAPRQDTSGFRSPGPWR